MSFRPLKPDLTHALHSLSYQLLHSRLMTHRIQIKLQLTGKSRLILNFTGFYTLNSCLKDIKPHLKRLNVAQKCVASEGELILARARLFDGDVSGFTICPKHRDDLGTEWKPTRKCQYPLHGIKTRKPERGRGVNLKLSKEIMAKWHVLIPTGAGIYTI